MIKKFGWLLAFISMFSGCTAVNNHGKSSIVMEEFRIASEPGIEIFVRNKR